MGGRVGEREFENRKIYSWVVKIFLCASLHLRTKMYGDSKKKEKKGKRFEGGEKGISSLSSCSLRHRPRIIDEKRRSCGSERD